VKTIRVTVRGHVQGVGFRNWIARRARKLELAGWVRNRSDGSVEIRAAGAAEAVEQLVALARRGPPFASVTETTIEDADDDVPPAFTRLPTL
jgi:acylphosphatase